MGRAPQLALAYWVTLAPAQPLPPAAHEHEQVRLSVNEVNQVAWLA